MSASNPPPPLFSLGPPVPPPIKKQRASGTNGSDRVLDETDDAIARRRAELGRLQQMQKQSVPTMNLARDQLLRPPSLPATSILPPNRGPPPPKVMPHAPSGSNAPVNSTMLEQRPLQVHQPGYSLTNGSNNQIMPQSPNRQTRTPMTSPAKNLQPPLTPVSAADAPSLPEAKTSTSNPAPTGGPPISVTPSGPPPTFFSSGSPGKNLPKSVGNESPKKSQVSFQPAVTEIPRVGNGFIQKKSDTDPSQTPNMENKAFAGHTPFHMQGNISQTETPELVKEREEKTPPTSSRKEMLSTMRSYADTPPGKDRETKKSLEVSVSTPYTKLPPGDTAFNKEKKQVAFLSPNASTPTMRSFLSTPQSISKRAPTPHPKLSQSIGTIQQHLVEAAEVVPFEYESDTATFTVRRPFGLAAEIDLWFSVGALNAKMYSNSSDVSNAASIEVVADVHFDGSVLVVNGDVEVRHKLPDSYQWKEFGNIKENETVLGNVSFIDSDASEKQYSLDAICEGALAVREHYCSSILSTGEAFRLRNSSTPLPKVTPIYVDDNEFDDTAPLYKSPTSDANVGTEDLPFLEQEDPSTNKSLAPPPPATADEYHESGSDVLSTAVNLFFSTIFSTIWFFMVRIPFLIVTHIVVMVIAIVLLSVIRLYVADDNSAAAMGATTSLYNEPGIL